jgi:hypothetical protein
VQAHVTLKIVLLACSQGLISSRTIEHDDLIGAEGDLESVAQCGHGHWVDFEIRVLRCVIVFFAVFSLDGLAS